jgi:chromosome segregation ATPase
MVFNFWKFKEGAKKRVNQAQRRLDDYKPPPEKSLPPWIASLREVESEVESNIKALQLSIKNVKDVSLKLEELTKMLKNGEISESIYRILLDELSGGLSSLVDEIFKVRENLELLRARAKVEWAKEKIGIEDLLKRSPSPYALSAYEKSVSGKQGSQQFANDPLLREFYPSLPINRWQEIINRIDNALSSLTFEEELSIIEKYLSIVKGGYHSEELKGNEVAKRICQQRLNVLSEKWFSIRRDKIKRIMDLEMEASRLRDEIKEVEVRFMVGEYDKNTYELRMSKLQGSLRNIEKEISEIRNYINDIDQKIFRINELLREG